MDQQIPALAAPRHRFAQRPLAERPHQVGTEPRQVRGLPLELGAPKLLFSRPRMALQEFYRSYDVHPDGKRFLMLSSGDDEARRLSVIFNWRPEVQHGRAAPP